MVLHVYMPVQSVRIVKPGSILVDAGERPELRHIAFKQFCGIGGGSTVTYVESDAKILVDTGFDFESNLGKENIQQNKRNLRGALKRAGLKPSDIDILFITHWHIDHFVNYQLFRESEVVMLREAVDRQYLPFRGVRDGEKLADGVTVVATPGHTPDHASLLLETVPLRYSTRTEKGGRITGIGKVTVAVAGDAVLSPAYFAKDEIWRYNKTFFSEEAARASVRKLRDAADYIIPGHGGIIQNERGTGTG